MQFESITTQLICKVRHGTSVACHVLLDIVWWRPKNDSVTTMKELNQLALALPEVVREMRDDDRPAYLVSGKLFCFHRVPRKDAVDIVTGERLDDVLAFRVADDEMKAMWLADERSIFFTTDHFNGHPWILLRIRDLPRVTSDDLGEVVSDAWLAKAPARLTKTWLDEHSE
jgi:hypothetical protein